MNILNTYKVQVLMSIFLIVGVATIGSLSLIWMRQQVSHSAYRIKSLERSLSKLERKNNYLDSRIATIHNPNSLKRLANDFLRIPRKQQIVWVSPEEVIQKDRDFMEKRNESAYAVAYMNAQK